MNIPGSVIHSSSLTLRRSFNCLYWTRTAFRDSQRDMKCSVSSGSLSQSLHIGSTLGWLNFALFAWRTYAPVRILHWSCALQLSLILHLALSHTGWYLPTDKLAIMLQDSDTSRKFLIQFCSNFIWSLRSGMKQTDRNPVTDPVRYESHGRAKRKKQSLYFLKFVQTSSSYLFI